MISWLTGLKASLESFFIQRDDWMLMLAGNPHQVQGVVAMLEQASAEWSDLEILIRTEPFDSLEQYAVAVCQGIESDWEALRVWVSLEGGAVPPELEPVNVQLEPLQRLQACINALRLLVLRTGMSRLGVVLVPSRVSSLAAWQQCLRRLLPTKSERSGWAGSRLIAWSGDHTAGALGQSPSWSNKSILLQDGPWSGCVCLTLHMTWDAMLEQLERDEQAATDTTARQSLQLMRGSALLSRGRLEAGFATLADLIKDAEPVQAAGAALVSGQHRQRLGQLEDALKLFGQAQGFAERVEDPVLLEAGLVGAVTCLKSLEQDEGLMSVLKQLLLVSTTTGNLERHVEALEGLVRLHTRRDEGPEALSAARLGLQLEEECLMPEQAALFRETIKRFGTPPAPIGMHESTREGCLS